MRVVVLIALTLFAMACRADRPAVVEVTSLDQFSPGALRVATGTRVVWKNMDTAPHTVTSNGAWDSGDIYPGQTWSHTFDAPGTYMYADRHAPPNQTVGVITVQNQ